MLSVKDIAAVQTAINVCSYLKREILSAPDYISEESDKYSRKKRWNEMVEKKAAVILDSLGLEKQLQKKVIGIAFLVGVRMLTWVEYHESILSLSREYCINFFNSSFITQRGIIDNKKAAEELIKDETLSIKQKYKIACLYCFIDHIPALHRQMTTEVIRDAEKIQGVELLELEKFWFYPQTFDIDGLMAGKTLDQQKLETAAWSGSKAAVEYCLEKAMLRKKMVAIVDAAMVAVNCRLCAGLNTEKDWIVFRNPRYKYSDKSWVPSDYYVDILCFLLSKMGEDEQIEFLKQDIEGVKYKQEYFVDQKRRSRVLECFLNWPYQNYFMKTAKLMWEFLPQNNYAILLLRICDKINPRKEENLKYGEERSYDYRSILKEFWYNSPERYKRYVFDNRSVMYVTDKTDSVKTGIELLIKLLTLKNFDHEDRKNIKLILDSATHKERENILTSQELKRIFIELMKEEKWEMLDDILLKFLLSKEEEGKFKRQLSFTKEVQSVCIDFAKNDKWNAAESFIKWSSLPEEETNKLKKQIIYSSGGLRACVSLISYDKVKSVDNFIRWWFPSEEEVKEFRKKLIFSAQGTSKCSSLVEADQVDLVTEFINFCLLTEKEVRKLKKTVASKFGSSVCEGFISGYKGDGVYVVINRGIPFQGGKWEEVEKYLTWCFSSEKEIRDFKKNELFKRLGTRIHFNIIKSNKLDEAERFFAWLGLSAEEIKELKKETLFNYDRAIYMIYHFMQSEDGDERFVCYGSKAEAIELLFRWYLTDKETVLQFRDKFLRSFPFTNEKDAYVLEYFDLMLKQRLRDLEQLEEKRKSETFPPHKRFCNVNL